VIWIVAASNRDVLVVLVLCVSLQSSALASRLILGQADGSHEDARRKESQGEISDIDLYFALCNSQF
jgi:hypothetical protein